VAGALDLDPMRVEELFQEIEEDTAFLTDLRKRYGATRPDREAVLDIGRFKVLYALVRISRPAAVLETGVHDGLSSALILRALERNGHGALTSIDLPSTDLPLGVDGPGWLVRPSLRKRWKLLLGDSRKLLSSAAAAAPVDLFIHDSDHSRGHREFELRAVRGAMSPGGLLVSDDDEAGDTLLDELALEWHMVRHSVDRAAGPGPHFGLLVPAGSS
jgi:predicted O-methyltransferase YrrM